MAPAPEITVETARKCLSVIDAGLVSGVGNPVPGEMCVEAAICYALGLPHGDDPGCVSQSVRAFKISLNDKRWSSPEARAKGLRGLAIAQLGSKGAVDDVQFSRLLAEATIRVIVPIALRAAAGRIPKSAEALEAAAVRCEQEGTGEAARSAQGAAANAYAAADAANAVANAYAAAADAANAYAAADAADARDDILAKSASLALNVLRQMNAPGIALWDAVKDPA